MSAEQNKALVRQVLEESFQGNLGVLEQHSGLHETIPFVQHLMSAMSDPEQEIVQQFADGDWVATRLVTTATHTGEFMG